MVSTPASRITESTMTEKCKDHTATAEVLIPNPVRTLDVERPIQTFGREVDMSCAAQRSTCNPEDVLFFNPVDQVVWDVVVRLSHGGMSRW